MSELNTINMVTSKNDNLDMDMNDKDVFIISDNIVEIVSRCGKFKLTVSEDYINPAEIKINNKTMKELEQE